MASGETLLVTDEAPQNCGSQELDRKNEMKMRIVPLMPIKLKFFFLFLFNVPVNNFSVMLRRSHLFLGITSTFGE